MQIGKSADGRGGKISYFISGGAHTPSSKEAPLNPEGASAADLPRERSLGIRG